MAIKPIRAVTKTITPAPTNLVLLDDGVAMGKATLDDAVKVIAGPLADTKITALNLNTASRKATEFFATAAQGTKADTAIQTIVAGQSTSINNTDPRNPVVGFTGTGTGDMLKANDLSDLNSMPNARKNMAVGVYVANRTALRALDTSKDTSAYLTEARRKGQFFWDGSNLSAQVTADTAQGVYIAPASAPTGASGAWVRSFDFTNYEDSWFGTVADNATDSTNAINAALAAMSVHNPGYAAYLNVRRGVRFSSNAINWNANTSQSFAYIRYGAGSDLTVGVPTGGQGASESHVLSVNSGFPNYPGSGLVGEWSFDSPLNPALVVNTAKNVNASIYPHIGPGQTVAPHWKRAVRASGPFIRDENQNRFYGVYQNYAGFNAYNFYMMGAVLRFGYVSVGGGVAAWGSPLPVAGDIIRGQTSCGRVTVTSKDTNFLYFNWLAGALVIGEKGLIEKAVVEASFAGGVMTVTKVLDDTYPLANGHTLVGTYAGLGLNAGTTLTSQISGTPGGVGTYNVTSTQTIASNSITSGWSSAVALSFNHYEDANLSPLTFGLDTAQIGWNAIPGEFGTGFTIGDRLTLTKSKAVGKQWETVTNASLVFTNDTAKPPVAGRQIVLDDSNRLVAVKGTANGTGSGATALVSVVTAAGGITPTPTLKTGSFNVAFANYVGTGVYRLNFSAALDNVNYQVGTSGYAAADEWRVGNKGTNYVEIKCYHAGALADASGDVDVIVFGGLA